MNVETTIRRRYSCRRFRCDPVPRETLMSLLDAARLAPSACNRQPWRFAVVQDADRRRELVTRGFRGGLGMKWALDAPVHIVLGMQRSLVTHRLAVLWSGVNYPWIDIGIAGEHLVLRAAELGLGSCWIGWLNPRAVRRIVGWPLAVYPAAVIVLGRPAETAPERRTERKALDALTDWK